MIPSRPLPFVAWKADTPGKATRKPHLDPVAGIDALDVTLWLDRDDRAHDEDDSLDIDSIDIDKIVDNARGKG